MSQVLSRLTSTSPEPGTSGLQVYCEENPSNGSDDFDYCTVARLTLRTFCDIISFITLLFNYFISHAFVSSPCMDLGYTRPTLHSPL